MTSIQFGAITPLQSGVQANPYGGTLSFQVDGKDARKLGSLLADGSDTVEIRHRGADGFYGLQINGEPPSTDQLEAIRQLAANLTDTDQKNTLNRGILGTAAQQLLYAAVHGVTGEPTGRERVLSGVIGLAQRYGS